MAKTSTGIKIEKGIPLWGEDGVPPLPLEEMQVGDSFVLSLEKTKKGTIRQRLSRYQKQNEPKRFALRTINDSQVRVFRVENYK